MRKLGLIAGAGDLPLRLAERCRAAGRPLFVIRLQGIADPALASYDGMEAGIAELGRGFAALRRAGCEAICLAGHVKRPDLAALKPDLRGLKSLPGAIAAAAKGDDALLRFMIGEFESEGFAVEGPDQVDAGLTLPPGPLGRHSPGPEHQDDIAKAVHVAKLLGSEDIGQGAVVAGGLVLAAEAQEGTDAMLARCAALPPELRGTVSVRKGVLVKWPKPIQERRVDLPTLGVATVRGAAAAGLAGIAGEARGMLVIDAEAVAREADALGLFVVGLEP